MGTLRLALALALAGCTSPNQLCTPGASVACTGPGGCAGGQVCADDGQRLGTCECGVPGGDAGADLSTLADFAGPPPDFSADLAGTNITMAPADVTLDLMSGAAPPSQAFTVTLHATDGDHDVSTQSTFTLADPTIGTMTGNVFTAGTAHGGTSLLTANWLGENATATIHVRVNGSFSSPDCASGCSFPAAGAPACGAGTSPTIVYPPDGVLLPPNLEQITLQWLPGTNNTLFEVDLTNAATHVTVLTHCTATVDTRLNSSGGCKLDVSQQLWDFFAKSNQGGAPIQIAVRATDGTCIAPSANTIGVSIGEQDVDGAIYYWQSTVTVNGTGGAIYRKQFGDTSAEQLITPMSGTGFSATCYGCHTVSRDGLRMTVNVDDSDSDDEYSDVSSGAVDVVSKIFLTQIGYAMGQAPGFQTFNHDHSLYLGTSGDGTGSPTLGGTGAAGNAFFLWNGNPTMPGLTPMATISVGATGTRPTQPDWSLDDKSVVYVLPLKAGGGTYNDDSHVFGGSLWTLPYLGGTSFGAAVELLHSNGENNYYPAWAPDGSLIAFNRVPLTGTTATIDACTVGSCPNDSFSNPAARVFMLPLSAGATPVDLEKANGSTAAAPVAASNSWPRWSPFVQTYKGSKLAWVTFSSTRDYGLLVRNHVQVAGQNLVQCYPPDDVEEPGASHGQQFPANCQQPQIWMAAINLSTAQASNPGDPSYPAFWLPFQNTSTHNHSAQWSSTVATMPPPPPDAGACIASGADCTKDPNGCCGTLVCTSSGTCGIF
jgi:hypothetical protein